MRHGRLRRSLGIETKHRQALLRNLVKSLVIHKRIRTTVARAKEASAFADGMVELAKRGDLHARRLLIAKLGSVEAAQTLIKQIAPHFKERQGGYTRVIKMGTRPGDGAQTALLEFTAMIELPKKPRKPKKEAAEKETGKIEEAEKPAKEKTRGKAKEKEETKAETEETPTTEGKKPKKGFLGALRKFLKGEEETH